MQWAVLQVWLVDLRLSHRYGSALVSAGCGFSPSGHRAAGTQCHSRQGISHQEGSDFLFDILFWRLDTKRFNICLK